MTEQDMIDETLPAMPDEDDAYPRILPYIEGTEPRWPRGWSHEPTERDLVAMALDNLAEAEPSLARMATPRGAAVNIADYRSPSLKGWGTGWPTCKGAAGNLVTIVAARSGARFSVHRRISVLFDSLIDEMETRGYLCKPPQCGAYNCRPVAGTNVSSLHAWALAGDVNWTDNPYTSTGRRTMPLWVPRELFNPYGFAWGGDYNGTRKDFMHLEFMGTPAQADQMTTARLRALDTVSTGRRTLALTTPIMTGDDVREVQRVIARWYGLPASFADGDYGPNTVEYVKRVQRGTPPQPVLDDDGEVGPLTRKKLGLAP
jgi:hypothetical protein